MLRLVGFLGIQVSSEQIHSLLEDLCEEINPVLKLLLFLEIILFSCNQVPAFLDLPLLALHIH